MRVIRSAVTLPDEDSLFSGSRRVLEVNVLPERADEVAAALRALVARLPDHPDLVPLLDAGVADGRPFVESRAVAGEPLDVALATYGPAAVGDALPRLERLAAALDAAAADGLWHHDLTPAAIVVSARDTQVQGVGIVQTLAACGVTPPPAPPYAAPEVSAGGHDGSRADQFSLAAIAFEWLFGRRIDGPADHGLSLPPLRDVDTAPLARVFTRALARDPDERYPSCRAFVEALDAAARPDAATASGAIVLGEQADEALNDLPLETASDGSFELPLVRARATPRVEEGPAAASATPAMRSSTPAVLGVVAIIGLAVGAAAMWWSGRTPAPATNGAAQEVEVAAVPHAAPSAVEEVPLDPPLDDRAPLASDREATRDTPAAMRDTPVAMAANDDAAPAATADAALLIHSVPAGGMVVIDGVERGTTPVAVRGLEVGTRRVTVTHQGYRAVSREITLTTDRPSRAVEFALEPVGRPTATPATRARTIPATSARITGTLRVESRPVGAAVAIDGRRAGVTPLTVADLPPGRYTVRLERPGYRPVVTTVNVNAGEQARLGVRLEGGRQQE